MATKRVYIITESKDIPPQKFFSNLTKLTDEASDEYDLPSYDALYKRLARARDRTGRAMIRMKDKNGKTITIEVRDLE